VQNILKRFIQTRFNKSWQRTGRKRLPTVRDDRIIEKIALENRKTRSLSLTLEFNESVSRKITGRTIRRRL
jgi:hypothetical protein